jgi:hypothetical protein
MAFRTDILAGQAVIQVSIQDTLDRQLRTMKSKLFAFSNSINKIGQDLQMYLQEDIQFITVLLGHILLAMQQHKVFQIELVIV